MVKVLIETLREDGSKITVSVVSSDMTEADAMEEVEGGHGRFVALVAIEGGEEGEALDHLCDLALLPGWQHPESFRHAFIRLLSAVCRAGADFGRTLTVEEESIGAREVPLD